MILKIQEARRAYQSGKSPSSCRLRFSWCVCYCQVVDTLQFFCCVSQFDKPKLTSQ